MRLSRLRRHYLSATMTPTKVSTPRPLAEVQLENWQAVVAPYARPNVRAAVFQTVTTLGLLLGAFGLAFWSLSVSYWLTFGFSLLTSALSVRTFIIMHDCTHSSFLPSKRANEILGFFTGLLTVTPFDQWRREHALHHATSGDLDRRGYGDINTITVDEYKARSKWGRFVYRVYRNPLTLLGVGPLYLILGQRWRTPSEGTLKKQLTNVWITNAAIVVMVVVPSMFFGFGPTMLVFGLTWYISAIMGIWLFYVQHQYEDTYWEPHSQWSYATAAIKGSSYLRLPKVLQWFTGNIGLHHVHHLNPRIPNYNLQRCHDENPLFHDSPVLSISDGLSALRLALWDKDNRRLIRFSELRTDAATSR